MPNQYISKASTSRAIEIFEEEEDESLRPLFRPSSKPFPRKGTSNTSERLALMQKTLKTSEKSFTGLLLSRKNSSPGHVKKGPFVVKLLCGICIAQIVFTIYVAIRVLNATLQPEKYIFSGGLSALADREREIASAIGDLDQVDMEQPVEFIPEEVKETVAGQSTTVMHRFLLKPLSMLGRSYDEEEHMNRLIISGNVKEGFSKQKIKNTRSLTEVDQANKKLPNLMPFFTSLRYPTLKKFDIRPIEDLENVPASTSVANTLPRHYDARLKINPFKGDHAPELNQKLVSSSILLNTVVAPVQAVQAHSSANLNSVIANSGIVSGKSKNTLATKLLSNASNMSAYSSAGNKPNLGITINGGLTSNSSGLPAVHIYGKAAVGRYLWTHILQGPLEADTSQPGTLVGQSIMEGMQFLYREGPGLIPVPHAPSSVVLVINGRTEDTVVAAKVWLDHLSAASPRPAIVLVMLGSEACHNEWVRPYVSSGLVRAVLLTYDDPTVDDITYFQWPLGVATYREFPSLSAAQVRPARRRPLSCTVSATLHANSPARLHLAHLLEPYQRQGVCEAHWRDQWQSSESLDDMQRYVSSLLDADLALCPAGHNPETYRIYEAFEAGAVPVMVDTGDDNWQTVRDRSKRQDTDKGRPSTGASIGKQLSVVANHRQNSSSQQAGLKKQEFDKPSVSSDIDRSVCAPRPYRLLRKWHAPVLWLRSWDELPALLDREASLRGRGKSDRRQRARRWYAGLKRSMAALLLSLVKERLVGR